MKNYRVTFGAYVRMYADLTVEAGSTDAARKRAITEFVAHSQELPWLDPNYDNLALPSIVSIQSIEPPGDVLDGYDFPITPTDARQYAAPKLLAALIDLIPDLESEIDQRKHSGNDEDWLELDRKVAAARDAIADATRLDPANSEIPDDPA